MKPDLLRPSTAARELDISRKSFHRLRADPDFPKPIRLTARTLLFKRSELEAYFEGKRQTQPTEEAHA